MRNHHCCGLVGRVSVVFKSVICPKRPNVISVIAVVVNELRPGSTHAFSFMTLTKLQYVMSLDPQVGLEKISGRLSNNFGLNSIRLSRKFAAGGGLTKIRAADGLNSAKDNIYSQC